MIAAVLSLAVFILIYMMGSLITLIPATSAASLIGCYGIALLAAVILYYMTKNPVAALSLAVAVVFVLTAVYLIRSSLFEGLIQNILSATALFDRFTNFTNGILDITSLVYYASVSALFVFFTVQSMEKKRWA